MSWNKTIYTRENGYGHIDTHAEQFQVGRRLYDTQVLWSGIDKDPTKPVDVAKVKELCHWYCELVAWVGQLRADYDVMRQCAEGKAEFREK